MSHTPIILASSSQTRKDLMNRLGVAYECISPEIDESPQGELHADDLAKRLAFEKAKMISEQHPNAIVIGSDQVAWREGAPDIFIGHYKVKFRKLDLGEIERYVERDQPLHCAVSFMCESLGISLFEQMIGQDQTTLMGMPMIQLCKILRKLNLQLP